MLGHKERNQLELFITGSLRQLIPDDHVLVRVDRVLDLAIGTGCGRHAPARWSCASPSCASD